MAETARYEAADGIARVTLDNPPLNALGHGLRDGIARALAAAEADETVGVIILCAAGRSWPVGADIREFGLPPRAPVLPDLCAAVAACPKPVIAVLHGSALGGGLELALAAAVRVAAPGTDLGLPEVTLGILPGAGGTQRLPRLIGAKAALSMILSGRPVPAEDALVLGLVDRVASDPLALATRIAEGHISGGAPLPPAARRRLTGAADADSYLAGIAAARSERRPAHDLAAPRIIDCVEAALLLPPDEGMAFERAAFLELAATPEARALRHAFFAERRAGHSLPVIAGKPASVATVAIAGSDAASGALASHLLARGAEVRVVAPDPARLDTLLQRIAKSHEKGDGQETGPLRLTGSTDPATAAGAGIAIAFDDEGATRLRAADAALPILRLWSSSDEGNLGPHEGAIYLGEPFARQTLAEVILPDGASDLAGAAKSLAKRAGWRLLAAGPVAGFLAPRYWTARRDAADRCLALGALPHEVDLADRAFGQPLGPFELADIYGIEHRLVLAEERTGGASDIGRRLRDWLRVGRRAGRRDGLGYYRYDSDGHAKGDPDIAGLLDALRTRRPLGAAAIGRRMLGALANAGAQALVEGRARCPSDWDLVAIAQGYPRWRGGPMQAADEAGLLLLRDDLRAWAEAEGDEFWWPAPIWDELIREGSRFADMNVATG